MAIFDWKGAVVNLLKAMAILLGVLALGRVGVMVLILAQEHDGVYKARIARAQADMAYLEFAIELFAMKYGHYPDDLTALAPGDRHAADDRCFIPSVPASPWDTPYYFEIAHTEKGDKVLLWTIPDKKTQDWAHVERFSNDMPRAWPGPADQASAQVRAGVLCSEMKKPGASPPRNATAG